MANQNERTRGVTLQKTRGRLGPKEATNLLTLVALIMAAGFSSLLYSSCGKSNQFKGSEGTIIGASHYNVQVDRYPETSLAMTFPKDFDKRFREGDRDSFQVQQGTKIKVLDYRKVNVPSQDTDFLRIEVLILDGPHKGEQGWIDSSDFKGAD